MLMDLFRALGLVFGLLSMAMIGMLLLAGIALACVKRNEDGQL